MSVQSIAIVTSVHPDFDTRIWRYATSLADAGLQVHLVAPWRAGTRQKENVHFHFFQRTHGRIARLIVTPWRILRTLNRIRTQYQIVHFHDLDLLPLMTLISSAVPVIYDVHENYPDEMLVRHWVPKWLRKPLYHGVRITQRSLARRIGNIVLVVETQGEDFDLQRTRMIYVRNYASSQLAQDGSPTYASRPPAVLFHGSQNRQTGSLLLLEIASIVRDCRPNVRFILSDRFSSRDFRTSFLKKREELKLTDVVNLIQPVAPEHVIDLLNRARIGILPSSRIPQQIKGVPRKLYEYLAAGLPVVASDLPLLSKVIDRWGCGLTARPEEPETFASCIVHLVDDVETAERMGRKGRLAFEECYSWESQMADVTRFYDSILRDRVTEGGH